jgi:serine protease AprX
MFPLSSPTNQSRYLRSLVVLLLLSFVVAAVGPSVAAAPRPSYIVQAATSAQAAELTEAVGGTVTADLTVIDGVTAQLDAAALASLQANPVVRSVFPNAGVVSAGRGHGRSLPASDYPEVVGADAVWAQHISGAGVTVAVVDTGLGWHPGLFQDMRGRVRGRLIAWKDFVDGRSLPRDPNGHGTHVAGIIANTEKGSDGHWNGVAPGVKLVGVRVLDENGAGTYDQVIRGIQWVIDHKDQYGIRVMNLSLVSPVQSPYWADPLNQAVMKAWQAGIVVVVAAGNGGPGALSIGVPGNNPYVVTVGAFTDNYTPSDWSDDYIAPFSAAGPTLDGFAKPDLVAPGAHMVSTMLPYTRIARGHDAQREGAYYFSMAGTSQAAAVVSGMAALVLSAHPELTPDQVKHRLTVTALPWVEPETTNAVYSLWQQGAGRANALDAATGEVDGFANVDMDIAADIAGTQHYQGFSVYDETTGKFHLLGDFADWDGGYWAWDGGFGLWSGSFGSWSGSFGSWSGSFGSWSGSFGSWSGSFGSWSGSFGSWSGSFGSWSGGYTGWAGSFGSWSGSYGDPNFVANYLDGQGPAAATRVTFVNGWVEEPPAR